MMIAEVQNHSFRRILIPLGVGIIALAAFVRGPAQAQPRTFVIDGHEGYGISDCFVDGVACGKVVANSWCESQGLGPAVAFGMASDLTASIGAKDAATKPAPGAVVITCGE